MSLQVPIALLRATSDASLKRYRDHIRDDSDDEAEFDIDNATLDDAGLEALQRAAAAINNTKVAKAVEAILSARRGAFGKPVPSFKAFQGVLEAYLRSDFIDGWIYVRKDDGKLYPQLVTGVTFDSGTGYRRKGRPHVQIHTAFYGVDYGNRNEYELQVHTATHTFHPEACARRRIADALEAYGIYKETPELRAAHDVSCERFLKDFRGAFSKQLRMSGVALHEPDTSYDARGKVLSNRPVIHDVEESEYADTPQFLESTILPAGEELGLVPAHPVVRVFDLKRHVFLWTHSDLVEHYKYDKSLRDKLVLPATHRDLLDVLTSNLDAFTPDIIEGKAAGNVILAIGVPGVGKTLTAEVYAELTEMPLYAVPTGTLGTTAEEVESNLETVFQRANRWNVCALIDEADVLVARRGNDLQQNAVCAVLLRALEYHAGLVFMTSNRGSDIDEAFLSRCAAIIKYPLPSADDAARIWNVLAKHFGAALSAELVSELVELFPMIAARDIKMLLRLAMRVSLATHEPLSLETFRRCAMFRAIGMSEASAAPA